MSWRPGDDPCRREDRVTRAVVFRDCAILPPAKKRRPGPRRARPGGGGAFRFQGVTRRRTTLRWTRTNIGGDRVFATGEKRLVGLLPCKYPVGLCESSGRGTPTATPVRPDRGHATTVGRVWTSPVAVTHQCCRPALSEPTKAREVPHGPGLVEGSSSVGPRLPVVPSSNPFGRALLL